MLTSAAIQVYREFNGDPRVFALAGTAAQRALLPENEFGLLLENCPAEKAMEIAEIMRLTVQNFRYAYNGKSFLVGVSIGMVMLNQDSDNVTSLLTAADAACYAAKDNGRNRIHLYEPEDGELAKHQGRDHQPFEVGQREVLVLR